MEDTMNMKTLAAALLLLSANMAGSHLALAQGATDAAQSYTAEDRAFLDRFIVQRSMPSMTTTETVRVGMQLPPSTQYHAIEGHPRFAGHRYTHINNNHVIVDATGRVVAIHQHRH
jgi:hypothetical protein